MLRQIIEQEKVRNDSTEKNNIEKDIISYRLQSAIGKSLKRKEIIQYGENRGNRN